MDRTEECMAYALGEKETPMMRLQRQRDELLEAAKAAERLISAHTRWTTASGKAQGNTVPGLTLADLRTAIASIENDR